MRLIVTEYRDLKKDISTNYNNLEELLLKEFSLGFKDNTQLFIDDVEVDLTSPLKNETISKKYKNVIVAINPKGGVVQTVIGIAVAVYAPWVWVSNLGVGIALGGISQIMMDKPEIPQDIIPTETPQGEEVFTTQLSQIKPKLGKMVPVGYGTFKKSPDLISEYKEYINGLETHHLTTVVGYGEYFYNNIYLGDINIVELNHPDQTVIFKSNYIVPTIINPSLTLYVGCNYNEYGEIINDGLKLEFTSLDSETFDFTLRTKSLNEPNWRFERSFSKTINNETIQEHFKTLEDDIGYLNNLEDTLIIEIEQTSTNTGSIKVLNTVIYYNKKAISSKFFSPAHRLDHSLNDELGFYRNNYFIPSSLPLVRNSKILTESSFYKLKNQYDTIDYLIINCIAPNGIYTASSGGGLSNLTVDLKIILRMNEDTITIPFTIDSTDFGDKTLNTRLPFTLKIKSKSNDLDCSLCSETYLETQTFSGIRKFNSITADENKIFLGTNNDISIKIIRDVEESSDINVSDKIFVTDIFTMSKRDITYPNISCMTFNIVTTDTIATSANKNLIVQFQRRESPQNTYLIEKVDKVINDLFTNNDYGGKFSSDFLNLPTTTEKFNHCFTQNQTILEAIRKTAISGMYMLTSDNGISLSKIQPKPRQLIIPAERYRDLVLESQTKNEFMKDGYRVFYRDENYEEQHVTYPEAASYPNELRLYGCSDVETATKYAKYLFLAEIKRNEKYTFTLDEIGTTLEQFMRVGLAIQQVRIGFSGVVSGKFDLPDGDGATIFKSDNDIIFDSYPFNSLKTYNNEVSVMFFNENLEIVKVLDVPVIHTNDIFGVAGLHPDILVGTPFHLGFNTKYIRDIVIEEITPNNDSTFQIVGRKYDEEVYQ